MYTYKLFANRDNVIVSISRSDGSSIPLDPANTDYQEYLKWLAEGNTPVGADDPLPADPVE